MSKRVSIQLSWSGQAQTAADCEAQTAARDYFEQQSSLSLLWKYDSAEVRNTVCRAGKRRLQHQTVKLRQEQLLQQTSYVTSHNPNIWAAAKTYLSNKHTKISIHNKLKGATL